MTKTPYRISFFGGGTDYSDWYSQQGGCFLSVAIQQYSYCSVRSLKPFNTEQSRIVWREIEQVKQHRDIKHPVVREALKKFFAEDYPIEIHHQGDLPARSGIGSSSAFTAGCLLALSEFCGMTYNDKLQLVEDTIQLERVDLREEGGIQDQYAVVLGGLNYSEIDLNGCVSTTSVELKDEILSGIQSSLFLVPTSIYRNSNDHAKVLRQRISSSESSLMHQQHLCVEAFSAIRSPNFKVDDFGELLATGWDIKRRDLSRDSRYMIDIKIRELLDAGATGCKLCGAGGGGFILAFVPHAKKAKFNARLRDKISVLPVAFDFEGSRFLQ